jgi:hypothetical protein
VLDVRSAPSDEGAALFAWLANNTVGVMISGDSLCDEPSFETGELSLIATPATPRRSGREQTLERVQNFLLAGKAVVSTANCPTASVP